jgi:predicted nuclease with TOPRIM domain
MSNIAERYIYLSRCYIELADKFQKLDVEHMTLKSKMVPVLKAMKTCKQTIEQLTQEKLELEQKLQAVTAQYEELKSFEVLLQPETQAVLAEAEEQMSLVQETLLEIDQDSDPGMSEADKLLLEEYYSNSNELNGTNSNHSKKLMSS